MPCSCCSALHGVNPNFKKTNKNYLINYFTININKITLLCFLFQSGNKLIIKWYKKTLTISKFFFSAVNVTGFSVRLLLRKLLIQLSINLIGNAFLLIFLLNGILLNEILKSPKQLRTFKIIKWKSNQLYILRKWNCWNLNILY